MGQVYRNAAGDRIEWNGSAYAPVQRPTAKNAQTGERVEWDGTAWKPLPSTPQSTGRQPEYVPGGAAESAQQSILQSVVPSLSFNPPAVPSAVAPAPAPQAVKPATVSAPPPVEPVTAAPAPVSPPLSQEPSPETPAAKPLTTAPIGQAPLGPRSGNNAYDSGGDPLGAFERNFSPDQHNPLLREQFMTGVDRLQEGGYATLLGPNWRALQAFDRIDRGETVPETEDAAGYQHMDPQARAQVRADAQKGMVQNIVKMAEEHRSAEGRMKNPIAGEVVKLADAGKWSEAWELFKTDPAGVIGQTAMESAALALPAAVAGLVTAPIGGVPAALAVMGTGNYPLEYGLGLTEQLGRLGVDINDPVAVEKALKDPAITAQLQQFAHGRGTGVAAGELAFSTLSKLLPGGTSTLSRLANAAGHGFVELGGEMVGEAAGQQAVGDDFQLGQVLAEGVGAGPTVAVATGAKAAQAPVVPDLLPGEFSPQAGENAALAVLNPNAGLAHSPGDIAGTVAPAPASPAGIPRAPLAVPPAYAPMLEQATTTYDLPANLLSNMMLTESGGNPNARSPVGAHGLMQFMPPTAAQYGVDTSDPASSIDGAGRMMRDLLQQFGGNVMHAVAAYNWGSGNVRRWLRNGGNMAALPPETQGYIAKVLGPNGMAAHQTGVAAAQSRAPWAALPNTFAERQEVRTPEDIVDLAQGKRLADDELEKIIFGATGKTKLEEVTDPAEILTVFDAVSSTPAKPGDSNLRGELEQVLAGDKPVDEIVTGTEATINPAPPLEAAPKKGSRFVANIEGWDEPEGVTVVDSYNLDDDAGGTVAGVRLQNVEGSIVYDGPVSGVSLQPIGVPTSVSPPVTPAPVTDIPPAAPVTDPVTDVPPVVSPAPDVRGETPQTIFPQTPVLTENPPPSGGISESAPAPEWARDPLPRMPWPDQSVPIDDRITQVSNDLKVLKGLHDEARRQVTAEAGNPLSEAPGGAKFRLNHLTDELAIARNGLKDLKTQKKVAGRAPDAQTPVAGTNNAPEAGISAPAETADTDTHLPSVDQILALGEEARLALEWASINDPVLAVRVAEAIAEEQRRRSAPEAGISAPGKGGRRQVGRNRNGNPVWEDENGVRSYVEGGVRITESVQVIPGRGMSVDKSARGPEFQTVEETKPAPETEPAADQEEDSEEFTDTTGLGFESLQQVRQYDSLVERLGGERKPATQFHVLPVKPDVFEQNKGHSWLLSWAYKDSAEGQLRDALERGDKVILDNGAYTHWQQVQKGEANEEVDWDDFYNWAEEYANRYPDQVTVIIPDVIMGSEKDNDVLINGALERIADGQFRSHQLMPVWHTHESIERLERLATEFDRIAFGATGDQAQTGTLAWHTRLTEAFDAISDSRWVDSKGAKSVEVADGVAETPREPKVSIHMLRGGKFLKPHRTLAYPFDSADSSNVGRNAHRMGADAADMPNRLREQIDVPRFWHHHLGAEAFAAIINGDAAALAAIGEKEQAPHQKAAVERKERDEQESQPEATPEAKPEDAGDYGTADKPNVPALARRFALKFAIKTKFATIAQARATAASLLGGKIEPGSQAQKAVDEAVELGVVIEARSIIHGDLIRKRTARETYDRLVDLYFLMPTLGTRTSTSIAQQAYSTPVPLAFIASRLAGINAGTTVYEPSAGNGALLIAAATDAIVANELNPDRAANLRATLGDRANIHEGDATTWKPAKSVDVVIANPPFGIIKDNGKTRKFRIPFAPALQKEFGADGYDTGEIDHAITFQSLEAMKDDGSAVLILGGVNKLKKGEARSDAYNVGAKRNFFLALYRTYNVVDHFTVSGELYAKQGASWPVDVIVIRGRGRSERKLPAADVPRQIDSWDKLGELLNAEYLVPSSVDAGERTDTGADGGAAAAGAGEVGHAPVPGPDVTASVGSAGRAGGPGAGGNGRGAGVREGGAGTGGRADTLVPGDSDGPDRGQSAVPDVAVPDGLPVGGRSEGEAVSGSPGDTEGDGSADVSGTRAGDGTGLSDFDTEFDAAFDAALDDVFGAKEAAPAAKETAPTSRDTRTTGEVAASAASNVIESADAAMAALVQMFGGGKTINSGIGFSAETYAKAKPLFLKAAEKFRDFAQDVGELVRRMVREMQEAMGLTRDGLEAMKPYLKQFVADVKAGVVSLTSPEKSEQAPVERKPVERKADTETAGQVTYEPKSKVGNVGTLVPKNLQTVTRDALDALAEKVGGDLDAYVAEKLGYDADEVGNYFSAEQIDAIALGIDNIDKDAGFIIGDQTGVGKGRTVAAMIRYAMKKGKVPIFATEKPNLYKDMYRDLSDIGMPDIRILMTNAQETVPLDDDGTKHLKTKEAGKHNALLMNIARDIRGNPDALKDAGYDVVFTTYSQMQPQKKEVTARIRFLSAIADGAFVILDESHNAGGTEAKKGRGEKEDEKDEMSRATVARDLLGRASSVFYSSATYAKRPQSMSLYFKTDMRLAVANIKQLADLITSGGVPMQQVVAAMLAQAGQYIRRERSFAGVTYDAKPVSIDEKTYDRFSLLINQIQVFAEKHIASKVKAISNDLKDDAKSSTTDGSTGGAGAESTNFTSVMHNLVDQMLLAAKAPEAVKLAIEALERGEKPVLTVANTMGSFLADFAEQAGISSGEAIKLDFNALLVRYIERCRWYTVKRPFMKKGEKGERKYIDDAALGEEGLAFFKKVIKMIEETDFGTMPVSPIDYIAAELRKAGYKVGEITGRTMFIDYQTDGSAYLRTRPTAETNIAGRLKTISRFNGGMANKPMPKDQQADVMILNQAGATGLSLHANAKFGNQSKRQMIIVQAEKNIDVHMQLLGRVHRTGQVITPSYIQMVADVPAEKRPAAVLAKKMASLSANTTASRKGALSSEDVPDFLNEYGDQVAARIMTDNPDVHNKLWSPLKGAKDGEYDEEDAMRKVTGRIPLLPLVDQLAIYELLESEYNALIQQLDETGENGLEAKFIDLDAKTLSSDELAPANGRSKSPFAGAVTLERVDIRRQGKPPTTAKVIEAAAEGVGLEKVEGDTPAARIATVRKAGQTAMQALYEETRKAFAAYKTGVLDEIEGQKQIDAMRVKLDDSMRRLSGLMRQLYVGAAIRVRSGTAEGNVYGTVIGFKTTGKAKNPAALGSWKVTIQTLTAGRQTIPLSALWPQGTEMSTLPGRHFVVENAALYKDRDLIDQYDEVQADRREERFMVTGNLLAGFSRVGGKGSIVNFTDAKGDVRQGILMPKEWDPKKAAEGQAVTFKTIGEVLTFLGGQAPVTSADGGLTILPLRGSRYATIEAKASKSEGGRYFLSNAILDAAGKDFVKVGNVMRLEIPESRLPDVLDAILAMDGVQLQGIPPTKTDVRTERAIGGTAGDMEDGAAEILVKLAERMTGGRAKVTVHQGRISVNGQEVLGYAVRDLIETTLAYGAKTAERNIRHETIHVLRMLGLFSDEEWAALEKAAEKWRKDYDIDRVYAHLSEERRIEEAIAHAFAGDNKIGQSAAQQALTKVREFLTRLYRLLTSADYRTADAIFRKVEKGEIGTRSLDAEFENLLSDTPRNADGTFAVKTELLASVRAHADNTRRAVRALFKGVEVPAGVTLKQPPSARDLNALKRFVATPSTLFKPWPDLNKLVQDGIRVEIESSVWVNRLNREYSAIRKGLSDEEWGRTTEALWEADEAQYSPTDEEVEQSGLTAKEVKAFRDITNLLEKIGRLVDQHRRQMLPQVRKQKNKVENRMMRLASTARVMSDAEFKQKYARRAYLSRRMREGKGDPVAITAEIQSINDELAAIRMSDPVVAAQYDKLRDEYDALEARLAATSVRRRAGYVPHKFYGSWRMHEKTGVDADGNPVWKEITSDQGFYDDKVIALRAAEEYLKAHPGVELKVEPKTIKWPFSQEGTQLSDAAYNRFVNKLRKKAGVQGKELSEMIKGVARKRFRRRIYGPGQFRTGAKGWAKDIDRVMRTHIGQSVRYITMDKMKFNVINTMESMGLSSYKVLTRDQKVLYAAFDQWWKDLNGQKQTIEEQFDSFLNQEWVTPLRMAMVWAAPTMLLAGTAVTPFFGAALAGYLGYRFYGAVKHGGDFKTRALTGSFLSDMAHLKLGAFFNVGSALVNLTQLSLNTYPVLGEKYATIGIARATKALAQSAMGKTTPDIILLGKADVDTRFRFAETHPGLFQQEGKLSQISMFLFQKAETVNRAATFLGALARAEAKGMSHGDALKEAKAVLLRTQFHYGNSNKPEILRNVIARLPLQFKNFMVNQITFTFGLRKGEIPRFLMSMVLVGGLLGLPALQLIDAVCDTVAEVSPIQWIKDKAIDAMEYGDTAGTVASMVARGLPGYMTDITSRVGMGDKFLPSSWSDLQGPWLSTVLNLAELQSQGAGAVDQLRVLTGGAAPLKSLEAMANGMPLFSMFTSPAAFGEALTDGENVITNPYLKGAKEYEPTTGELVLKGIGLKPIREAQLADVRGGAEREMEQRQGRTRPVLTAMIAAYRAKGGGAEGETAAETVITNAEKRGIVVTKTQIHQAFRDALTDRELRTLKKLPKILREDTARRQELLNEFHAH